MLLGKVVRVIVTLFGFLVGYSLVRQLELYLPILSAQPVLVKYHITAALGGLAIAIIGFFLSPWIARTVKELGNWLDRVLVQIPGQDMVAGFIGILLGLATGTLLIQPFRVIPFIGEYLPIVSNLLLAYLGMFILVKKREDIISAFSRRGAGGEIKTTDKILDTSVIIDGRIADICDTGFMEGKAIIPRFVLDELQHIADSSDTLKRNRGRRGLDILNRIRKELKVPVQIVDEPDDGLEVDSRLVKMAQKLSAKIVTNDYNLNKVCELQGVPVLNINELANAVKPVVLPGEEMDVQIIKDGKETGQGIGYLDDGTMIVVDGGRGRIGDTVSVVVTSVLQTAAGRMIFAKLKNNNNS